jgi:CRISPR-associated protein Csm1
MGTGKNNDYRGERMNNAQFEDYFNQPNGFKLQEPTKIHNLLNNSTDFIYISGDFYGIQKFIFEGLATKNASKVLRAKSAFIQLFTMTLARYICSELKIEEKYILSENAGKFEILSPQFDENTFNEIQKTVDNYFVQNFYGLSGVSLSFVACTKEAFQSPQKYKDLRKKILDEVEKKKFNKFNLLEHNPMVEYPNDIKNQTLCKICNIRKMSHENCDICNMFVELGKWLGDTKDKTLSTKDDLRIDLDSFDTKIKLDTKIKSYVRKDEHNHSIDFDQLAEKSQGLQAIGVLKADVDNMGTFIKESSVTNSFANFDLFSKTLDAFFSLHIPDKIKQAFPNTYIVFAGGDDLFLIGAWNEILALARWIEKEFKAFVKDKETQELTISFGIAVAQSTTTVSFLADHTEHLLEKSKEMGGKDAITLFGETVKWFSYQKVFEELDKAFKPFENKEIKTAFLYRLLELCEMSKKVKEGDIIATMWKSKLRYSFSRNNDQLGEPFYEALAINIDKNPKETKMFLCEFIYTRRER